jgi:colanic acid biosynthesis glycosyl transferase WcaI
VLVLHQHYWPEIAATAQVLSDLCEDLVSFGHEVKVVCGQPSYRGANERRARQERHRGVEIDRVWSYAPARRGIPQRLAHYVSYFGSSLQRALTERPDVCFVMSTPPLLLGVAGSVLRRLRGCPFVYSVQDLYPDVAVHLGVVPERGLITSAISSAANACYREAAALVTLSDGMASKLMTKGVPADKIHVIPNWADTTAIAPVARDNAFARTHGLAGCFVVQYSGNLGLSQGLECLLAAASLTRDVPVTWLLVGDGNAREGLASAVQRQRLDNVRFLPPQPREHLSELLGSCNVGLVPMRRDVSHDLVPSKLYGIMAAARPVLASVEDTSEVARTVRAHDCGWVVTPESPDAMAAAVRRAFATSRNDLEAAGQRARRACLADYSRQAVTRRYDSVLRAVGRAKRAVA